NNMICVSNTSPKQPKITKSFLQTCCQTTEESQTGSKEKEPKLLEKQQPRPCNKSSMESFIKHAQSTTHSGSSSKSQNTNHKPLLIINPINSVIPVENNAMFDFSKEGAKKQRKIFQSEPQPIDPKKELQKKLRREVLLFTLMANGKISVLVEKCIAEIEKRGLEEVGMYHVPGIAGYYPSKDIICYTSSHTRNKTWYKVPDNYIVETSWEKGHIVECEIEYQSNKPVFRIKFKENSQQYIIESNESPSKVANDYLNVKKKSSNTRSRISGIHVFGLHIINVEHEWKHKKKKKRPYALKLFNLLSEFMKTKCLHAFFMQVGKIFESEALNFYNQIDQPVLQEVQFNVQSKNYSAIYYNEKEQNIDTFVNVINKGLISCDAYRDLTALEAGLPREYNVTNDIEKEMLQYVGKVGYRPITNILLYIILDLVKKNTLNKNNPIVHLRISEDRWNVGKKIKYVMITCAILDDILNIYQAECHYMIVLYPGRENYETLQNAMEPMINELHIDLSTHAIDKVYTIKKSMDQLKSTRPLPGHRKAPLLPMIPLKHYVLNKLCIMLRIWDRLWSLNHSIHNWSNMALMGDDKETVMRNFNFEVIFDKEWSTLINCFWREFDALYIAIKQPETNTNFFAIQAKNWLSLFFTLIKVSPTQFITPKTMKDSGDSAERKSAIFEILSYENWSMYFAQKSTSNLDSKR
ncbi:3402_t:CDS:10, partial [Gigaspora margarita]